MTAKPALADLRFLAGAWNMELSGASFLPNPDTVVASPVTFDWIEDGGALVMHMGQDATWIIGRDDADQDYFVLYSDGRGISRVYRMSLTDGTWRMWRDNPEFAQRFQATIAEDQAVIDGHWEKSQDAGTTWEHDFNVHYSKTPAP